MKFYFREECQRAIDLQVIAHGTYWGSVASCRADSCQHWRPRTYCINLSPVSISVWTSILFFPVSLHLHSPQRMPQKNSSVKEPHWRQKQRGVFLALYHPVQSHRVKPMWFHAFLISGRVKGCILTWPTKIGGQMFLVSSRLKKWSGKANIRDNKV